VRTHDPRKWGYEPPTWLSALGALSERIERGFSKDKEKRIAKSKRALAYTERRFGRDSPLAVNGMERLAHRLREVGRDDESIPLLQEVMNRRRTKLGPDNENTVNAEGALGLCLARCARHQEAVPLFEHALRIESRKRPDDDVRLLKYRYRLGRSLLEVRRYEEAQLHLERAHAGFDRQLGGDDQWTINALGGLALSMARQKNYLSAIEFQRDAVEANARKHGTDGAFTLATRLQLAAFLHWVEEDAEAFLLVQSVLDAKRQLGVEDDMTEQGKELLASIDRTAATD
jgi:tetratricopeptide (TPR) repeat protein